MWHEESDATGAVNGMYSLFRGAFSEFLNVYGELRTNLYKSGPVNDAFYNNIGKNEIVYSYTGCNWSSIYQVINSANLIIKHAPSVSYRTEEAKNEVLANAYFIRAFCYYELVRVFGDCPLLTQGIESDGQDDMYPYREKASLVYDQVESDILSAEELMPASSKSLHKASPAAIKMLKTDFYLWKAKRLGGGPSALQTAQSAINSVLSAGYSLTNSFADAFTKEGASSPESIWTIPYINNENVFAGKYPNTFSIYLAPAAEASGTLKDYQDIIICGSHAMYIIITPDYYDFLASDSKDTRTAVSARDFRDNAYLSGLHYETEIVKFAGTVVNGTRIFDHDVPMYRLAEAYLLKAEVENALGNASEAVRALNVVAKRAYKVDNYYALTGKDEIDEAIIDESLKEFVAESKAWWVILRMNKEFSRISTLVGRQGELNVTLWPVAQACINSNPNITQTEGYR